MEYAVYRVFLKDGWRTGTFVNMLASREEAEAFVEKHEGEHRVVGLWTREITPDDEDSWDTVAFSEGGSVEPVGQPRRGE